MPGVSTEQCRIGGITDPSCREAGHFRQRRLSFWSILGDATPGAWNSPAGQRVVGYRRYAEFFADADRLVCEAMKSIFVGGEARSTAHQLPRPRSSPVSIRGRPAAETPRAHSGPERERGPSGDQARSLVCERHMLRLRPRTLPPTRRPWAPPWTCPAVVERTERRTRHDKCALRPAPRHSRSSVSNFADAEKQTVSSFRVNLYSQWCCSFSPRYCRHNA